VSLGLAAPEDQNGDAIGVDLLPEIAISFEYFKTTSAGDGLLKVKASDYPSAWQSAVSDTVLSGAARDWDPETQTVTITETADPSSGGTHDLELWNELFLDQADGATVTKIRLTITFKASGSGLQSAVIAWFKKGC
jgi:hypothetical protein